MSTSITVNSNNPISLHHSGPVTEQQTRAFDTLLTQLAKVVSNLKVEAQIANNQLSTRYIEDASNQIALINWQLVLNDLLTVVLPEFYVVFHDLTANAMQKRRLYDITQTIHYYMIGYAKSDILSQLANIDMQALANKQSVSQATLLRNLSNQLNNEVDNYITGEGANTKVAYELENIARFITVDSFYYLDSFDDYYKVLIDKSSLIALVTVNPTDILLEQLQIRAKDRILTFTPTHKDSLYREIVPFKSSSDHPLAVYLSSQVLYREVKRQSTSLSASPIRKKVVKPMVPFSSLFIPAKAHPKGPLITKPKQFMRSIGFASLGAWILGMASFDPVNAFVLLGAVYFCCIWLVAHSIIDAIDAKQYAPFVQIGSLIMMVLSLIMLFSGGLVTGIAVHTLIISTWLKVKSPSLPLDQIIFYPITALLNRTTSVDTIDLKPTVQTSEGTKQPDSTVTNIAVLATNKTDASNDNSLDETTNKQKEGNNIAYAMPLEINRHGYHLAILLSEEPTERLKSLIEATNTLYGHIDYLQSTHPYLATRVDEMIKDLTYNTLVRLDETASHFVKDGKVSDDVRAMFKQQHEARIDELLTLNLTQINDLNQSILQKQMAGFANVDSPDERQFRDTLMELKIVLRWLIAQQPDEVQASSHQVILDNLESSTLADMQAVFFEPKTTDAQRQELQSQLDKLLAHFKQQTTQHIQLNSAHQDDNDMQELLQLSKPKVILPKDAGKLGVDSSKTLLENQKFIEFNKHYVDQILSHWH